MSVFWNLFIGVQLISPVLGLSIPMAFTQSPSTIFTHCRAQETPNFTSTQPQTVSLTDALKIGYLNNVRLFESIQLVDTFSTLISTMVLSLATPWSSLHSMGYNQQLLVRL